MSNPEKEHNISPPEGAPEATGGPDLPEELDTSAVVEGAPQGPPPDQQGSEEPHASPSPEDLALLTAQYAAVAAQEAAETSKVVTRIAGAFGIGLEEGPDPERLAPLEKIDPTPINVEAASILGVAARFSYLNGRQVSGILLYEHLTKSGYDLTPQTAMEALCELARLEIIEDPKLSVLYKMHPELSASLTPTNAYGSEPPTRLSEVAIDQPVMNQLWQIDIPNRGDRANQLSDQAIKSGTLRHRQDLIGDHIQTAISEAQPGERFLAHCTNEHIPRLERKDQDNRIASRWATYVASEYIPAGAHNAVTLREILHAMTGRFGGPENSDVRGVDPRTAFETIRYLAGEGIINQVQYTSVLKGIKGNSYNLAQLPWETFARWLSEPQTHRRVFSRRRSESPRDSGYAALKQLMSAKVYKTAPPSRIAQRLSPQAIHDPQDKRPVREVEKTKKDYYSWMQHALAERRRLSYRNWKKQPGLGDIYPDVQGS